MDKLSSIRGCPGLSYLNTAERAMLVLNLGLANLALSIDPNADEWLLNEVLAGTSSMKAVRAAVNQYAIELPKAITVLERR